MQVRHSVSGILADIQHQPVAILQALGRDYGLRRLEEIGQKRSVVRRQVSGIHDMFTRNYQNMSRSLRLEVSKSVAERTRRNSFRRYIAGADPTEKTIFGPGVTHVARIV
jgi:hypothetical protein